MAPDHAIPFDARFEFSPAREPEPFTEMLFFRGAGAQMLHPRFDFEQTLATLPLLDARRGDADADRLRAFEQARVLADGSFLVIDEELGLHLHHGGRVSLYGSPGPRGSPRERRRVF